MLRTAPLALVSCFVLACEVREGPELITSQDTLTSESSQPDVSVPETFTPHDECGQRECGTVAGFNACGDCDPGERCSSAGRCVPDGPPMGAFCETDDGCFDQRCLGAEATLSVARNVCTSGCSITKDADANGVNDVDAPGDDCNPSDIVDGPAGSRFRCVDFAVPGDPPKGVCVPGSEFRACTSDRDCPDDEGCELTTIGGAHNLRCVARYRENGSWTSEVVGVTEACGADRACDSGPCLAIGCVKPCTDAGDCGSWACTPRAVDDGPVLDWCWPAD